MRDSVTSLPSARQAHRHPASHVGTHDTQPGPGSHSCTALGSSTFAPSWGARSRHSSRSSAARGKSGSLLRSERSSCHDIVRSGAGVLDDTVAAAHAKDTLCTRAKGVIPWKRPATQGKSTTAASHDLIKRKIAPPAPRYTAVERRPSGGAFAGRLRQVAQQSSAKRMQPQTSKRLASGAEAGGAEAGGR